MANNRISIETAKKYYADLKFYLSAETDETLAEIADVCEIHCRNMTGDMVAACVEKGFIQEEQTGHRRTRLWIGKEELTPEVVADLEDGRVRIAEHHNVGKTWAGLISAGAPPTTQELTAIMALCTDSVVVTAFRNRKNR